MNKAAWDALPDTYQGDDRGSRPARASTYNYAETEAKNPAAMNKMLEEYGVTNVRWTDEELAAFEQAWNEVLEEQSASDHGSRRSPTATSRSVRSTRPGATPRP